VSGERGRVLQLCEPPDGGAAVNATELALRLTALGFDVEYAGPLAARRYERLASAGVPVHRLPLAPGYFNSRDDVAAMRGLRELLRRGRYQLVHCHSAKAGVLGRLAARGTDARVVYSPHNFPFMGDHTRLRVTAATLIERRLAPLTDAILCVCEWERRLALERRIAPPERLHVVHNGTDPCPAGASPDPRLKAMREEGPLAGTVAGLRRFKGIEVLVDAAPAVLERVPGARLAIVGDGPLRAALEERARRLGLMDGGRVVFLDFHEPAARYLRALDLYVLPSLLEAFPIGVLEALACGVPQVATDVGGTSEAVAAETGVLVPPGSPGALADAIAGLLEDPERRRAMAAASPRRHAERFLADAMAAGTARLYDELLGGRDYARRGR
jgi:glycosyltransferase involved in cell wall biosynthesis